MTGTNWRHANLTDRLTDIADDARIAPDVATAELDATIHDAELLTEAQARRLTERIKLQAQVSRDSLTRLQELVGKAQAGQAHVALGFASWTAYLADLFADEPLRLDRGQRQELVGFLAGEGMSTRAIAPIVGASVGTVQADRHVFSSEQVESASGPLEGVVVEHQPVTGLDGKTYERSAQQAESKPQQSPLGRAARDLSRVVERLEALAALGVEGGEWAEVEGLADRLRTACGG